jgi:bacterioferritin-associated ferredoxin
VYICLCNALTDTQVREAASSGAMRVRDVYAGCGCQAQCGRCTATVLSILREERAAEGGAG